jgi:hypothetical protein
MAQFSLEISVDIFAILLRPGVSTTDAMELNITAQLT